MSIHDKPTSGCGPWSAAPHTEGQKIKYAICAIHGGHSRTTSVDLYVDRCHVARRALPTAKRRGK